MLVVHNMSAPPHTEVRAEKRGIADRIVVFSLLYALTVRGFLEKRERRKRLPNGRDFEEIPWNYSSDERSTIRVRWQSPGDLFARIGEPKHLPISPADEDTASAPLIAASVACGSTPHGLPKTRSPISYRTVVL